MLKATYVQQCAHNTSERRKVQDAMNEKMSKPRRQYLKHQLAYLTKERNWLESIKGEFKVSSRDCLVLD